MISRVAVVALLLALLCVSITQITLAQTAPVGVITGNTFTYEIRGLWSSSNTTLPIGQNILQLNETEYFKVNITDVSGSDISLHTLWRFTNGTENESDSKINVATGIYNYYFWAIFPANLNVGERIHPYGPDQITVNGTTTRNFINKTRETNRFIVTGEFASTDNTNRTYNDYMTVHFDRQTGMLVELNDYKAYTNPAYSETVVWEIIDTNAWTDPEFPTVLILLPVFIIVVGIALIAIKKRTKSRKRKH
jgi:hypothetical protein